MSRRGRWGHGGGRIISALLGRYFWIPAGLALAAGFWLPGSYGAWSGAAKFLLGGILFFSCLNVRGEHLRQTLGRPGFARLLLVLTTVKLVALPLGAWALTQALAPSWAAGVLLVSAMPAGLTSIAFADLTRGNQVLALLLVLMTSVLCPVSVPLLLGALHSSGAHLGMAALGGRALYILGVLLVPFAVAQLVRRAASDAVARFPWLWSRAAVLCTCLLVFVSVAINRDSWHAWRGVDFAVPLALVCASSAFFAVVAWLVSQRLDERDAVAYACGSLFMNNGLAIVLAVRFFPGDGRMVLPAVLMQVPMTLAMALLARVRHRAPVER